MKHWPPFDCPPPPAIWIQKKLSPFFCTTMDVEKVKKFLSYLEKTKEGGWWKTLPPSSDRVKYFQVVITVSSFVLVTLYIQDSTHQQMWKYKCRKSLINNLFYQFLNIRFLNLFLTNENWTKIDKIFAKMRSKNSSKVHQNSRKFWTKINKFRSFIFANFVPRKFRWKS